jgi:uncharacterized membrane protein
VSPASISSAAEPNAHNTGPYLRSIRQDICAAGKHCQGLRVYFFSYFAFYADPVHMYKITLKTTLIDRYILMISPEGFHAGTFFEGGTL